MGNRSKKVRKSVKGSALDAAQGPGPTALGELIHQVVRGAIEEAVSEELDEALGAGFYERHANRNGFRNGNRVRVLSGPTGPAEVTVPRARLWKAERTVEWHSNLLPRYERRLPAVNEAIAMAYLGGGNTRRLRLALRPLLKDAPLSKSSVSRVVGTLKASLDAWRKEQLKPLEVVYLYLDAIALKVRCGGKVTSLPTLVAVAVLASGVKQLLNLEVCSSESEQAWRGFLDGLVARGLDQPVLCIIDGNAGLRAAVTRAFPKSKVQRCVVHKWRNITRKAPEHVQDEMKEDFHRIVYAESEAKAREARSAFRAKWKKNGCHGAVDSLDEAGEELLTYYGFPKSQWKTIRTTNVIERLNGEFRRRVKTQGSLPNETSAEVLLFSLVASGQIKLRRLDGFRKISDVVLEQFRAKKAA